MPKRSKIIQLGPISCFGILEPMIKAIHDIFQLALEKLNVTPSESVFIDDNIRHVEAAAKLDIQAIQFKSAEQLRADLANLGVTV